jgi:hypothetical protein
VVFSTTFPNDIFVDRISYDGALLGQYHVAVVDENFPASGGGTFPFLAEVVASPGDLQLRMAFFHERWPGDGKPVSPQWEKRVTIDLARSSGKHGS